MSKICKLLMMLLLVAACSKKDNREELTITDSDGNAVVYKVELAQSKDELTTGLMNRTSMDPDSGMIFDLSAFDKVPTAMWMKDTKLALDMLFIDQEGMIFWIYENAEPDSLKMIVSPYPATAVLEVNAGDVAAKGIKIGDMVKYKLFDNKATPADEVVAEPADGKPENVIEEVSVTEIEVVPANVDQDASVVTDEKTDEPAQDEAAVTSEAKSADK